MFTFLLTAAICLAGSLGVVLLRNPVHNALSLVATLFGVAVLFIQQGAYFLAAIQVIVYAGAIVILFLFVIMLLGVDRAEGLEREPILGQRPVALAAGLAILGLSLTALLSVGSRVTGQASSLAAIDDSEPNVNALAKVLFTDYVFAFEITSVLLTVAVVGAVVLARKAGSAIDVDEFPEGTTADLLLAKYEAAAGVETELADEENTEPINDGSLADDAETTEEALR
ncbi:MAG: NADH-quinone oxidoreductase subunit J [Microthrixaceae bacterium]